jgi:hypothetical protein
VGQRLPTLKSLLDRPETAWESIVVNWYDGSSRSVEISSATAVWYRRGNPHRFDPVGVNPRSFWEVWTTSLFVY